MFHRAPPFFALSNCSNFAPVDPVTVLERVAALPIQQWTYKAEADAIHHLGPMAQDFHAAFGLGANETGVRLV